MQLGALWVVLGLCLLSGGTWGQPESEEPDEDTQKTEDTWKKYKVSISGTRVVLTCPVESEQIQWEHNKMLLRTESEVQLVQEHFSEVENSGRYSCCKSTDKENKHHLYLKARVCESCMEVNLMAVVAIIIVDICITLGLLVVVYYWSKNRKAKAKPVKRGMGAGGRSRGQNKERPPPVPNPDYEPIRKGQRELYSGLNQRNV
ncbi:T-cell surface glycoprotein CD3 epsilon chain [Elephas maximus indicus]|uniref:T-cell surface glycoprotein CD3 epsilon chain n=1 Tax=Elephas maximus indicus TaxID=99487 RepID=UPI0021165829|nr:T-cell surface glycoprotein CD3 epsilon chain [Elephas maximus indicus]